MELSIVIKPLKDEYMQMAKQIGVDHVIDYNLNFPDDAVEHVAGFRKRIEEHGLKLVGIEGSPAHDDIIFGRPGRDKQIEVYKRYLGELGKCGAKLWCYNFNPSVMRVGRTSLRTPARGKAITSGFRLADWNDDLKAEGGPISDEQLWDNLEYFLKRVIPAAEEAGIKMAMHPDDPPLSPMMGLSRLFINLTNYERLVSTVPSPSNGICLCVGTFGEMGVDVPAAIRKFAGKINYVHLRNVRGPKEEFVEIFHDEEGNSDLVKVLHAYKETGYDGFARADHVPLMAGEEGDGGGYSFNGRIFALGYLRGVMHGVGMR